MHEAFITRRRDRGAAALEVLLLIPFIVLIWMLIVNMGYNGFRHRMAQASLRFASFEFVDNMATMNRQDAAKAAASAANSAFFDGENEPAKFQFTDQKGAPQDPGIEDETRLLANASSRETGTISLRRSPPYADLFPRTDIGGRYIIASNTWTYCEMKDKDHKMDEVKLLDEIGKYGLWLFGGCGGSAFDFSCDDRCP